jgi:hypothetical protein
MKQRSNKVPRSTTDAVRDKASAKSDEIVEKVAGGEPDSVDKRRVKALEIVNRFSHEALPKLADLAHVPKQHRDRFWWDVGDLLLDCLITQGDIHENLELRKNASFARAVDALKSARQALAQIDDAPREAFAARVSAAEEGIEVFLAELGELEPKRQLRRRGRPHGKVKDPASHKFARQLLECASRAGGNLTLQKYTQEGTLIEALKMLAPYLPKDVAAEKLPSSTLQRIKTEHGRWLRASQISGPEIG